MDLSRAGAPFENGEVVKVDPGAYWRKMNPNKTFRNEGVVGEVIGRKADYFLAEERSEDDVPDNEKSVVVILTMDDRIIEEHWSYLTRLGPLESLGACAE